jgi:phosphate transport system protein
MSSTVPAGVIQFPPPVIESLIKPGPTPPASHNGAHILTAVDRQLHALHQQVGTIGALAIEQTNAIATALLEGDLRLVQDLPSRANRLRELDRILDHDVLQFSALFKPVASDLVSVRALSRIGADLSRLAAEVEKVFLHAPVFFGVEAQGAAPKAARHLRRIARLAAALLQQSVQSFSERSIEMAREVVGHEDEIRIEFESAVRRLLTHAFEGETERRATFEALPVLNGLERIAYGARCVSAEILRGAC